MRRFLFRTALSLLLFFNLFFAGAIISSQVILKGEAVTVPDLTGKTLAEARAVLARKDLSLSHLGSEFSDAFEKGAVISQDPAPGTRLRVTKVVRVLTSSGSRNVQVPDLVGKSLENVVSLLREAGLSRGFMTQVHTPHLPAGRVIAQKPSPEVSVERGSAVGLLVSQGGQESRYVMPDLIYGRADRVAARLKELGFQVADIQYVYYPGMPSGVVVGQEPPFGYRVQKRSRISLEVSR